MDRDEKEDREILKFVLEQIYRAKRRKGQLDRRLENLKRDMQSAPGSQGRGRRTSGDHGDGTANLVVKKSSIEERIERQKDNVSISIEKTMDLLELLPETSLEREIMELRHLDMKDWKDIAEASGTENGQEEILEKVTPGGITRKIFPEIFFRKNKPGLR